MRVPVIDGPSVSSSGELAPSSPYFTKPDTAVAEGLQALGRGVERLGAGIQRAEDATQNALAAQVAAGADLEWAQYAAGQMHGETDAATGEAVPGFLSTKGLDAMRQSSEVLDRLEKKRQAIAGNIKDERAKARWLAQSAERMVGITWEVERHAGAQLEAAKTSVTQGLVAQHLADSEAGADFWSRTISARTVEQHLRGMAASPEAGDAAVAQFRAADGLSFTKGLLARGDVDGAAVFVEANKESLGAKYAEAATAVAAAEKARAVDKRNAEIATIVSGWAEAARDENGFVPEEELRQQARQLPPEDPRRDELDAALERQVRIERERLKSVSERFKADAELAALVDFRPIPADAEAHLRRYDPAALVAIQEKRRAMGRRARADKAGGQTAADERRAQASADGVFLDELETALIHDPDTDVGDFETEWIARRVDAGESITSPSERARSRAGLSAAKAQRADEKGERTEKKAFAARIEKTLAAAAKKRRGQTVDQSLLNERVGRALAEYDRRLEANGGRPLGESDLAQLEAELVSKVVVEPGFIRDKTALKVDTVEPTPRAEKTPSQPLKPGRYKDKKTGRVFIVGADGTKRPE